MKPGECRGGTEVGHALSFRCARCKVGRRPRTTPLDGRPNLQSSEPRGSVLGTPRRNAGGCLSGRYHGQGWPEERLAPHGSYLLL
ncbi:hypothetical protein R1flu_008944 [Riccia fluitans]|uniref:Uncharacterized protein n=1 Tax=Riccia fluitans TaxID=41844 RepID=A0ABD1Z4U1_9MARC